MKKETSHKPVFLFDRSNYILIIAGVVLNLIGFLLMIGGGAKELNDFNANELFSQTRITVAPILILLGYAVILYAIMKKPKNKEANNDNSPT